MKTVLILSAMVPLACSSLAADANPKEEVTAAAKGLGQKPNYSWRTTVVVPEGSRFRPGPSDGQTEKDGFTHVTMTFGENTTHALIKGDKAAYTDRDGEWRSVAEADSEEGPGRWVGMMVRNVRTPAVQAADLAAGAKQLKKDGEAYTSDLTEESAKSFLTFRRQAGGDGPEVSGAKGSVKFWLKEGALTKFEYRVQGTISFNGNDREVDRTTTVEIKDVGTTKVEVPEAAKKKLS